MRLQTYNTFFKKKPTKIYLRLLNKKNTFFITLFEKKSQHLKARKDILRDIMLCSPVYKGPPQAPQKVKLCLCNTPMLSQAAPGGHSPLILCKANMENSSAVK